MKHISANRYRKLKKLLHCSSCGKYMKNVCKAGRLYYCKPCVRRRMPDEPFRFQFVTDHHLMTTICEKLEPYMNTDKNSLDDKEDTVHSVYRAIMKLGKDRIDLETEKLSLRSIPPLSINSDINRFFSRLSIYYERLEINALSSTLYNCVNAGALVNKLVVEDLPPYYSGAKRVRDRIHVIVTERNNKHLEKNKGIFSKNRIPTLDIDYFKQVLRYEKLIVAESFLIVPTSMDYLKDYFPREMLKYDPFRLLKL